MPASSSSGSSQLEEAALALEQDELPFSVARLRARIAAIVAFALPVVLVPLADPIMSMIDTLVLGRQAGSTLQLAALGPCTLILNFCTFSFAALTIATVSVVSDRLKQHSISSSIDSSMDCADPAADSSASSGAADVCEPAARALASALFLAACGGAMVCGVLTVFGRGLILATGADPVLLPAALAYLRIRALAAPAALMMQVAQAGLLAQRDSLSPFRIVLVTSALSLAGDLLLITALGLGLEGAAWTTAAAQYLGAYLLLRTLHASRVPGRFQLPAWPEFCAFLDTFGILTVFYFCKTTCYLMLQSTAARLPPLLLAAHQPIWSLWNLVAFTNTPWEQAALTFLPAATTRGEQRELANTITFLGAANGILGAAVAVGLPLLVPQLFASDSALWGPMRSVGWQGTLAMLFCGVDVAATGCLLALKDTGYVARAMGTSLALLATFLWWMRQHNAGLGGVWWGLAAFFGLRMAQSLPRLLAFSLKPRRHRHLTVGVAVTAAG